MFGTIIILHMCKWLAHFLSLTGLVTTTSRKLDREQQDEHILEVRAFPRHLLDTKKPKTRQYQAFLLTSEKNNSAHNIRNLYLNTFKWFFKKKRKKRRSVVWHFLLSLAESHSLPASQAHARKVPLKKFLPVLISGWGGGVEVGGMWEILVTVPFVLSHCSVSWMEQAGTGNCRQLQQADV